jgi:hypothetical protein
MMTGLTAEQTRLLNEMLIEFTSPPLPAMPGLTEEQTRLATQLNVFLMAAGPNAAKVFQSMEKHASERAVLAAACGVLWAINTSPEAVEIRVDTAARCGIPHLFGALESFDTDFDTESSTGDRVQEQGFVRAVRTRAHAQRPELPRELVSVAVAAAANLAKLVEADKENYVCCVCMDRPVQVRFNPCNHSALCRSCTLRLGQHSLHARRCPLCRATVNQVVDLASGKRVKDSSQVALTIEEVQASLRMVDGPIVVLNASNCGSHPLRAEGVVGLALRQARGFLFASLRMFYYNPAGAAATEASSLRAPPPPCPFGACTLITPPQVFGHIDLLCLPYFPDLTYFKYSIRRRRLTFFTFLN